MYRSGGSYELVTFDACAGGFKRLRRCHIENEAKEIEPITKAIGGERFSYMEKREAGELIKDDEREMTSEEVDDLATPADSESSDSE
ncbi:hypothetical protein AVEN_274149-1 [Araneus ventricosus]|uniref:Uncharacterized protein n=1 Tax=Araneus ventricosus TaxID=182803 RepID=A0A4Y2FYP1_ARAVE|nr:hypothetical protein AVEN_274149-1 [Araneus ventricosus]